MDTYGKAALVGVTAGMRSMMAPALVSLHYARTAPTELANSPLRFMSLPATANVFTVLAGGELLGDKLPNTPNRTDAGPTTGRIGSGALCGAAIAQAESKPIGLGALAGGLGALIGTYAFYQLRHWLTHDKALPDSLVALAEDVLAIGGGLLLMNKEPSVNTNA